MVLALPPTPFPLTPNLGDYMAMHLGHAALATLIPVVFGNPNVGRSRRFLGQPAVVWLGFVSSGMYLWHFSIAYTAGVGGANEPFLPVLIVTLGLTTPLGALSWCMVERPMMRFKYRRRRPQREPA
jgi:peptidoglycan/LPS O-acetylase OafA/YrhL